MAMEPIEYCCDDSSITIRFCPHFNPPIWYMKRPLRMSEAANFGLTRDQVENMMPYQDDLYWDGERWSIDGPKHFPTAEAAYEEYKIKIAKKE